MRSMAQTNNCVSHMIKGMESRPDMIGLACEALHNMFDKNHSELVVQVRVALRCVALLTTLISSSKEMNPITRNSMLKLVIQPSFRAVRLTHLKWPDI